MKKFLHHAFVLFGEQQLCQWVLQRRGGHSDCCLRRSYNGITFSFSRENFVSKKSLVSLEALGKCFFGSLFSPRKTCLFVQLFIQSLTEKPLNG